VPQLGEVLPLDNFQPQELVQLSGASYSYPTLFVESSFAGRKRSKEDNLETKKD